MHRGLVPITVPHKRSKRVELLGAYWACCGSAAPVVLLSYVALYRTDFSLWKHFMGGHMTLETCYYGTGTIHKVHTREENEVTSF